MNNPTNPPRFDVSDLETDLDSITAKGEISGPKKFIAEMGKPTYPFPCSKCRGTGIYTFGYVNIQHGKCHACNGRGGFATSPEDRQNARAKSVAKKEASRVAKVKQVETFLASRPDVAEWFRRSQHGTTVNEFAESLRDSLNKYGSLTPNQLGAVERSIAKYNEYKAAQAVAATQPLPADALSLRNVPSGYYAVPGGDTRLKVQIDNVPEGKWAGWIFVKDGGEYGKSKRYGKQRPIGAYEGEIRDQLRIIASDPKAASAAYGKLVGRCGCCGRKLENEESIALGIGPVCAAKNGW